MKKLGIIGLGNMGSAIIEGLVKNDFIDSENIYVYTNNISKNSFIKNKDYNVIGNSIDIVKICDYIILAVKPQNIAQVLSEITAVSNDDKCFISIAAGITKDYISKTLNISSVVCVMPNILLKIGEGVTVIEENKDISKENMDFVVSMFSAIGMVKIFKEGKLNYSIPISGSSPAFIYYITKAFELFAKDNDISQSDAKELFCQTLIGSAKMMMQSQESVDELISKVTSTGGTTIKGIDVLEKERVLNSFYNCLEACKNRAFELSN